MHKYAGKLGMLEMEIAAECIMQLYEGVCTHDSFKTDKERIGFNELLYNGWLVKHKHNGVFKPSEELVNILRN